jgi:TolB-like protein
MANIFTELKKRKVFNSAAIYLATTFIILQVAQIIIPALHIPDWTLSFIVVLIVLGFPVVVIFSWIYDVSDKGLVKTDTTASISRDDSHLHEYSKSSALGIIASIIITIILIYNGVDYFTSSKQISGKTSIAVLNFDNIRKFDDYDWLGERIASNLTYKLGQLTNIRMIDRLQILNKLGEIDPEKASVIDYKINQVAKNIDVNLILHGDFTIMGDIIEITAFFADTQTGDQISLMLEQYPLEELSDIPAHIYEKISAFIKSNKRFKPLTE